MTAEEQAQQKQIEKDQSDRSKIIKKANDAEGTITIVASRAFHFQHPGKGEQIVVQPGVATIVPAWVQHSDTWALATRDETIPGQPENISVVKSARVGDGTAVAVSSAGQTDAPKTLAQQQLEADAAAAVVAQQESRTGLVAGEAATGSEAPVRDKQADADEQKTRLDAQKSGAQNLGQKSGEPSQQKSGIDALDANKAGDSKVTQGAEATTGKAATK